MIPGSRLSFCAAISNRAACASQGFVSCSMVRVCMVIFLFSVAEISVSPAIAVMQAEYRFGQTGLWPNPRSIGSHNKVAQTNTMIRRELEADTKSTADQRSY